MSKVSPLHPYPALVIDVRWNAKWHKYIVISDLHIGFESDLYLKGITMDSSLLVDEMVKDLINLVKFHKVDGIVILGDLKNTIGSISKQEWESIPQFFKLLSECANVYMVPGNHDSNIGFLIPKSVNMISTSGLVLDDTLLVHGHTMPSSVGSTIKRIIMGHIHPVFIKTSSTISGQRVWIYLKVKKETIWPGKIGILDIIVIPSFNKHLFAMTEHGYRKSICPLISRVLKYNAVERGMVLTLDGSIIGDTETLQNVII
jgi:putative SbcD/Mre11-related phosphoesterase